MDPANLPRKLLEQDFTLPSEPIDRIHLRHVSNLPIVELNLISVLQRALYLSFDMERGKQSVYDHVELCNRGLSMLRINDHSIM